MSTTRWCLFGVNLLAALPFGSIESVTDQHNNDNSLSSNNEALLSCSEIRAKQKVIHLDAFMCSVSGQPPALEIDTA